MAWFALKDAVAGGAECHHEWFHQRLDVTRCMFRPCPLKAPMRFTSLNVISVLNDWTIEYVWRFEAVHCWPPAIRAVDLLRARPAKLWRVADLARTACVSSATLERSFSRTFGLTVLQYQARSRLRGVVEDVYGSRASIDGILVAHGYRSPKAAYDLFRRLAGMTLSGVRQLSDVQYESLLDGPLALPSADCPRIPAHSLR